MSETVFNGFPPESLQFLADLGQNNDRDWFNARKQLYLDNIIAPADDGEYLYFIWSEDAGDIWVMDVVQ